MEAGIFIGALLGGAMVLTAVVVGVYHGARWAFRQMLGGK